MANHKHVPLGPESKVGSSPFRNALSRPTALSYYVQSPRNGGAWVPFGLEFNKKLCRKAFAKELGENLPSKSTVQMSLCLFDELPKLQTSRWRLRKRQMDTKMDTKIGFQLALQRAPDELGPVNTGSRLLRPQLVRKMKANKRWEETNPFKALVTCSGVQIMSADWLLEELKEKLVAEKRSVRAVFNAQIRDTVSLMNQLQSSCPVLGLRLLATGRLGSQKKGMAQQISRGVGKVPLGSFRHKIDYSQGLISTNLGVIGLKVWICYQ
jgi:hypothetical protein